MLALLDGPSQDRLEELADEPIPGSLIVLACRQPELAVTAALALGRRMLGAESARSDLVRWGPEGDVWLVDEVAAVASRLAVMPVRRHFLVLERCEVLPQRSYDRLLRIIEEPPSPTTVVLTVPDVADVPDTLLGRASAVLSVLPAPPGEQVAGLVSAGASLAAAREAVVLCASQVQWAPALASSSAARQAVKSLVVARIDPARPVGDVTSRLNIAASIASAVEAAAGGPVGDVPVVHYEDATPTAKRLSRSLLRLFAEHRRAALVKPLGDLGPEHVQAVSACLRALDEFELRLRSSVSPVTALAALAAESPSLRMAR